MSESTVDTQANGTVEMTAEDLANFQAYKAKMAADEARKVAAAEARKRANNRPLNAAGEEMPAGQGFVKISADYLESVLHVFQNDPDSVIRHMTDHLLPALRQVANAPRISQAATFDYQRKTLTAATPPEGTSPVPAPTKK